MRFVTLLVLTAALAPSVRAQADTTSAWRYMPLEVGNRWEYRFAYSQTGWDPYALQRYERWSIHRDSLIGGRRYLVLVAESFSPSGAYQGTTTRPLRYDTLTARVVAWNGTSDGTWRPALCPLNGPFNAPWGPPCSEFGGHPLGGGYGRVVLGTTTSVKVFAFASEDYFAFAAGIGFTGSEDNTQTNMGYLVTLAYASIGGRRYGTPVPVLPIVVASEPGAPPAALTLRAGPNPTTGPLNLTLALPAAGPVTVEAFDVTGRRVYQATPALAAGTNTLDVDAASWAPGVYVVRAATADGATTTRIVRH